MAKITPPSESVSATLPAVGGSPILRCSTRAAARTVAPPSTGCSTRAAARTVTPPSTVAGAAADETWMFELIFFNFNQPSLSVFSSHSISACRKLGVNDRNDCIIIEG
jgi:hypothetical protein